MPGRDVELPWKRGVVQNVVFILVQLAWRKKREGKAVRGDKIIIKGKEIEAAQGRLQRDDVVKMCNFWSGSLPDPLRYL